MAIAVKQYVEIDNTGYNVGINPAMQGEIAIRWAKLTYLGDKLIARDNHRTVLFPDSDIDATLDEADRFFESEGYGRMPESDRDFIQALADRFWTSEIKNAYAALRQEQAILLQATEEVK